MQPATLPRSVEPLTRVTARGVPLVRPAEIESEIAAALDLSSEEIRARASLETDNANAMSSECLVHLIRQDLRADSGKLADDLLPSLLDRCETNLRGAIRGFAPDQLLEISEDVLGRVALALAEPGDAADFFEVRFALALKRLRIDACRRQRRRDRGRVALDELPGASDGATALDRPLDQHCPEPARQEDRLLIRQALSSLEPAERDVFVLHRLAGMPLRSKVARDADLVGLLGFSERTLRNRLRAAEAKLRALAEDES